MKIKLLCVLLVLMLLCAACGNKMQTQKRADSYEIAKELITRLWEVDYKTFSEAEMTSFAAQYFEPEYRDYFLQNPEENVDVAHVKQTQLISHIISMQNKGGQSVLIAEKSFYAQDVEVEVEIIQFLPEDSSMYVYKEGQTYTLLYKVFFAETKEEKYIAGFSYTIAEEEKQPLSEQERQQMLEIAQEYINNRYNISYQTASAEALWGFYEQNVDYAFLLQDGITKEGLAAMLEEYTQYQVQISCNDSVFSAQNKPIIANIDGTECTYYRVEAEYTCEIEAEETFFVNKGISQIQSIKEFIYFEKDVEGKLYIIKAQYLE